MTPQTAQKHQQAKLFLDSLGISGPVSLLLRALAFYETRYGTGWNVPNTHNWGAVTKGGDAWKGETFSYTDPKYGEEINSPESIQVFRKYPSDESGVRDMLGVLERKHPQSIKLAKAGKWESVSESLYKSGYYGGRRAKPEDTIRDHMQSFLTILNNIVEATGEKTYLVNGGGSSSGVSSGAGIGIGLAIVGASVALFFLATRSGKRSRFLEKLSGVLWLIG